MATDNPHLSFQRFTVGPPKGAQCPSCFTFNLLRHLPECRKQHHSLGLELTCALCGAHYSVAPFTLDPDYRPIQEKGAA